MRIVVALGGNALLKRGEPMTADIQRANVRTAATSLAALISDGHQIWISKLTEPDGKPATIAAAPVVWNGMVYVGTSGAERACGCFVAGLDAATGRVAWKFVIVPTGDAPGSETWPKGVRVGGGSVWTSLTIDTASGLLISLLYERTFQVCREKRRKWFGCRFAHSSRQSKNPKPASTRWYGV